MTFRHLTDALDELHGLQEKDRALQMCFVVLFALAAGKLNELTKL